MGYFDDYKTRGASYDHVIRRVAKDGSVSEVTMNDKDYPTPPPGEKLAWLIGVSKPYTFPGTNQQTGEREEVEYIDLEFQIISGPRTKDLFLIGMSTKVSDRSNLGNLSNAIHGTYIKNVPQLLSDSIRKPVFIYATNESRGDWNKVKFGSARPYDEKIDGPIGGQAAAAPPPEPVAAAAGGENGLWDDEL